METILVTGGAGFIGSHLVEKLLLRGFKVVIIDNFNDYYDPHFKERNLREVESVCKKYEIDTSMLHICKDDIRDKAKLNEIAKKVKIDLIIHLAAMAGVRPSIEYPGLYYDVNVNGTLNLLETAKEHKIKKFIFGSSSSVYGNNPKVPFAETDPVDWPISPYAGSKKAGELLCYTYHHLYQISIACLRFFTVYGPRQRPDLAIHKFSRKILLGKSIPFYGDGSTARDYTYVDDITAGICQTVEWLKENQTGFEVFNLGNSQTVTLNEMVSTLEKVLEKKASLDALPPQPGDVVKTWADITKSGRVLGYKPGTDFQTGIEAFAAWLNRVM